jgi:hypothetical protein
MLVLCKSELIVHNRAECRCAAWHRSSMLCMHHQFKVVDVHAHQHSLPQCSVVSEL